MFSIFTKFLTIRCLSLSTKVFRLISKLFRFYVLSSAHVGLAVLSLLAVVHLQCDLTWYHPLFLFVFCATVVTYNFIRYFSTSRTNLTQRLTVVIFTCLAVVGLCFSVGKLNLHTVRLASFLGVLSFLYVRPNNRLFTGLRQLPYLKSFVVVSCWASVVVLLPWIEYGIALDASVFILWLQMALWTLATMIPFEIRDSFTDHKNMKTIPQIFGVNGSKRMGTLSLLLVLLLSAVLTDPVADMTPTLLTTAVAYVCLQKASVEQSDYYASFWVEAIPMFWLLSELIWEWI